MTDHETIAREWRTDRITQAGVRVDETPDWYVIRDSVAGRPGVYNQSLRRAEDLRKSYGTLDGKPIIVNHPPDDEVHHALIAVYPDEIHGVARNARWDDKQQAIVYDAYLYKRVDVAGYETTQRVVDFNKDIVDAIRAGALIDNSPGYQTRVMQATGTLDGRAYNEIRTDFGYWHVAIVPQGACGWQDVCGLGRAQTGGDSVANDNPPKKDAPAGAGDTALVADLKQKMDEQARKIDALQKCADDLKKRVPAGDNQNEPAARADEADLKAKIDGLEKQLKELKEGRDADVQARLTAKRGELAKLRKLEGDAAKILDAYPEAALDAEIALEKQRTARGDGAGIGTAGDEALPKLGLTVGRWDEKKQDWVTG